MDIAWARSSRWQKAIVEVLVERGWSRDYFTRTLAGRIAECRTYDSDGLYKGRLRRADFITVLRSKDVSI